MRQNIWAIGDLHLSFGVEGKTMDVFGPLWKNHPDKIAASWKACVQPRDLVLLPGDISWALKPEEVVKDLEWIDALPGTKVMIKGNHDYWWGSLKKLTPLLPPSIHLIQNNAFHWQGIAIGGTRLWDTPEYQFGAFIDFQDNAVIKQKPTEDLVQKELNQKIFDRELERLKMSLKEMDPEASLKIAMTHYPPIGANLLSSRASRLLEEYGIHTTVFGHLHAIGSQHVLFGEARNIRYLLVSADYRRFEMTLVHPFPSI